MSKLQQIETIICKKCYGDMKLNKIISDININGKCISNIGKITFFNQVLDGNIVNVNFVSKKFPYVTKNINMKNSYLRNLKSLS